MLGRHAAACSPPAAAAQRNLDSIQNKQGLTLADLTVITDLCTGATEAGGASAACSSACTAACTAACHTHSPYRAKCAELQQPCMPRPASAGWSEQAAWLPLPFCVLRGPCQPPDAVCARTGALMPACAAGAPLASLAANAPGAAQPACSPGVKLTFILQCVPPLPCPHCHRASAAHDCAASTCKGFWPTIRQSAAPAMAVCKPGPLPLPESAHKPSCWRAGCPPAQSSPRPPTGPWSTRCPA